MCQKGKLSVGIINFQISSAVAPPSELHLSISQQQQQQQQQASR